MANPNQRYPQGRNRDRDTSSGRYGQGEDYSRQGGAYGNEDRDDDEPARWSQHQRGYRSGEDSRDERAADHRDAYGRGLDQDRFDRGDYYGGARDYDSASRRYYGGEPGRELYSSPAGGGQPYAGESYEWQQGQGRQRGQRPGVHSQSGYYRERESDSGDRSYAGDYGRDLGGRGRPSHHSGYAERWQGGRGERTGYGRSGAEGVYGYASSSYGQPENDYVDASQGRLQDAGYQGPSQRGRGPKNYTRSDERIREDLSDQLTSHHDIDASDIDIEVKNGVVSLSGSVEQRRLKHEIEDMAERCRGVKDVDNRLSVRTRSSGDANRATSADASADASAGRARTDEASKKR